MRPTTVTSQAVGATDPHGPTRPLVAGVEHVYIPMADAPEGFAVLTE